LSRWLLIYTRKASRDG